MRWTFADQDMLFFTNHGEHGFRRTNRCGKSENSCAMPWPSGTLDFRGFIRTAAALDPTGAVAERLATQLFYRNWSIRRLMEQLDYNLQYCWFVGLSFDDPVRYSTVFTKCLARPQKGEVFAKSVDKVLNHPRGQVAIVGRAISMNGTLMRPELQGKAKKLTASSCPAKARPTTPPTMWPICVSSISHSM